LTELDRVTASEKNELLTASPARRLIDKLILKNKHKLFSYHLKI
jgi:hypothetical protein